MSDVGMVRSRSRGTCPDELQPTLATLMMPLPAHASLPACPPAVPSLRVLLLSQLNHSPTNAAFLASMLDEQSGDDIVTASRVRDFSANVWVEHSVGRPGNVIAVFLLSRNRILITLSDSRRPTTRPERVCAHVWSLTENKLLFPLIGGHTRSVFAACQLSSGLIATGSADHEISVWGDTSGLRVGSLAGHTDAVLYLTTFDRVAEDGISAQHLVSWSRDDSVKLWDLASMSCVATVPGTGDYVTQLVQVSASCLISWRDSMYCIWDFDLARATTMRGDTRGSGHLAAFPDLGVLAVAGLRNREEHGDGASAMAMMMHDDPADSVMIPVPTVSLYVMASLPMRPVPPYAELSTADRIVLQVRRVPDTSVLLALCQGGVVYAWDVLRAKQLWIQHVEPRTLSLHLSPDVASDVSFVTMHNHGDVNAPNLYDIKRWRPIHRVCSPSQLLSNSPLKMHQTRAESTPRKQQQQQRYHKAAGDVGMVDEEDEDEDDGGGDDDAGDDDVYLHTAPAAKRARAEDTADAYQPFRQYRIKQIHQQHRWNQRGGIVVPQALLDEGVDYTWLIDPARACANDDALAMLAMPSLTPSGRPLIPHAPATALIPEEDVVHDGPPDAEMASVSLSASPGAGSQSVRAAPRPGMNEQAVPRLQFGSGGSLP